MGPSAEAGRRHIRVLTVATAFLGLAATAAMADGQSSTASTGTRTLPAELIDVTWEWVSLQTPKDLTTVPEPANYTVTFAGDGAIALQLDCNRGVSSYEVKGEGRIAISPIASTMMMCNETSLSHDFTTQLERVGSFFQLEGDLLLEQPYDSGTLRFRPKGAD